MINQTQVDQTKFWLDHFREIYHDNVPMVLHSHEVDGNGAPQWSPQWFGWLTGENRDRDPSDRDRLKRAMKRVRERSLREYEVLVRILVQGQSIDDVCSWLNERSERGGHPERYDTGSTVVILFAAVDKLYQWWA